MKKSIKDWITNGIAIITAGFFTGIILVILIAIATFAISPHQTTPERNSIYQHLI